MTEPSGDHYILSSGRDGHERLRLLCALHDPFTHTLLLDAGLCPGKTFVEFGCGLGCVSRWAATRGARTTGVDLSHDHVAEASRLASEAGIEHVEFRQGSIYDSALPQGTFDFAYCRFLLSHLSHPIAAMRVMAACLKPGGVLVCEEPDLKTIYSEPPSQGYAQGVKRILELADSLALDFRFGNKLALSARSIGLEVQRADAYQRHFLGGKEKGYWTWSFSEARPSLLNTCSSPAELDKCLSDMRKVDRDPKVMVGHARMHQLVARKPS
ncbi:MAG: class I SAM-dependent methyltransferase [Bryobacterales bacterium]|nr:class I SAM-dependent methyltransferase [Bryobacterales bacterium]MDE0624177.1 class I SAM-dependent methyltransferase [Bryobacterales bacterium]